MSEITVTDNTPEIRDAMEAAKQRALEIIGGKVESYAKGLVPVDTGRLRNSITHTVEGDTTIIGSNTVYAGFVELGTGPNYTPPPEWMENNAEGGRGLGHGFVKARPYLRPAVQEHLKEYQDIINNELKNA